FASQSGYGTLFGEPTTNSARQIRQLTRDGQQSRTSAARARSGLGSYPFPVVRGGNGVWSKTVSPFAGAAKRNKLPKSVRGDNRELRRHRKKLRQIHSPGPVPGHGLPGSAAIGSQKFSSARNEPGGNRRRTRRLVHSVPSMGQDAGVYGGRAERFSGPVSRT